MPHASWSSGWHCRSLLTGLALLACSAAASGADVYDPSVDQLAIASVGIGNAIYSNMVVKAGSVLCVQGGTPIGSTDIYNPVGEQLIIPSVTVGATAYSNVLITVGSLVSIGAVTGADSYDGTYLDISYVQVQGGAVYTDVRVTVGEIVGIKGGMPANVMDAYDATSNQLTIAAVQVGTRVYTNVSVTVGKLVSVGGSQRAKSMPHPASGSGGTCSITPLNLEVGTLPGSGSAGLLVPVGGTGHITVIAENQGNQDLSSVTVSASTGATELPLAMTMCLVTGSSGDCSAPPGATLSIPSIAPGAPPQYAGSPVISVQVTASAAIASNAGNQILITFRTSNGTVVGSASVPVTASVLPVGVFAATATGNGILEIPAGSQGSFAVAAENLGVTSLPAISILASTNLPIDVTLCQTDPGTGQCLAAPAASVSLTALAAGANLTLAVFVSAPAAIPDDPAANLLFILFETADGTVVGSTSVGVMTL